MSLRKQLPQLAVLIVMAVAATSAIAAQQPTASVAPAIVVQPRPFGYVVGDLVTQRVLLTTPNADFQPAALPAAQRLNIWFERRAPRIESAADGRRWLVVDYQVINAPQTLTTVGLPAWELEAKAGGARLKIPAAPINVGPLIPSSSAAAASDLRPDREVPSHCNGASAWEADHLVDCVGRRIGGMARLVAVA